MKLLLKKSSCDNKKLSSHLIGIQNVFAIDLGTSCTKIYSKNTDLMSSQESILSIWKNSNKVFAFGNVAKNLYNKLPQNYVSASPINGGLIENKHLTKLLLKCLLNNITTKFTLSKSLAYFIYDRNFDENYKTTITSILKELNIGKIQFIDNIESSSIGMNLNMKKDIPFVILKIGAGSSSINIIKDFHTIHSNNISLTGDRIDLAIINFLSNNKNIQASKIEAEKIKKDLLSVTKPIENVSRNYYGKDLLTGYHKKFDISSFEIHQAIIPLFNQLLDEIINFFTSQSDSVKDSLLNFGLYLTGGASLTMNLIPFLSNNLQIPITISNTPENDAILGTKIILKNQKEMKTFCASA